MCRVCRVLAVSDIEWRVADSIFMLSWVYEVLVDIWSQGYKRTTRHE